MKNKSAIAAVSALVLLVGVTSSLAAGFTVEFGSGNDGLGGFTQSTLLSTNEFWSTQTDSVTYRSQDAGTLNSSLLRPIGIDRFNGSQTTIKGTLTWVEGYADDNNRLGMYLFGDYADINTSGQNQLEAGAIGLIFNTDDSSSAGSPGNNADDNLSFRVGIDAGALGVVTLRDQTTTPYAQDLVGTVIELGATLDFYSAGGTNDVIDINAWMNAGGDTTTITTLTVNAAEYTGNLFGFVNRARARNYDGDPDPTGASRDNPWVVQYETFTVIPEPATFSLVALMGGGILFFRRRFGKK